MVNIITNQAQKNLLETSLRYGRFNSTDANITASLKKDNWALQVFGNRNSSDGFDQDKTTSAKTVDPFTNYTTQLRFSINPLPKTKLSISSRYYNENQNNYFLTQDVGSASEIAITGKGLPR